MATMTHRNMIRSTSLQWIVAILAMIFAGAAHAQSFQQIPALSFTKPYAGANPLPQTLMVASTGAAFYFNVSASTNTGGSWLQVSPSGNGCCATPGSITVSVNATASLAVGTYTGKIVIAKYSDTKTSITIPVTLFVADAKSVFFDNMPGQVSFSLQTGGNTPPSQPIQIRNGGSGTLDWTLSATTASGGKWLSVSATSGAAPSTVSVGINPSALPNAGKVADTFVGQLTFKAGSDSVTIPVSVVVGDNVFPQVNAIDFTKPYAGANPLPQTLMVASTGSNFYFDVSAYTANGGDWLQVSPTGNGCCATPETITVSANPTASLAAGRYTGEVVITQYSGHGMAMTVPVTLTVAAIKTAFFDNLPGQLSFSLQTAGNAPPSQPVQIRNGGSGILSWTLSTSTADGGTWLVATPVSGTAPSTVSVGINPAALPNGGQVAGTFVGELVLTTGNDVVTIPVSVVVGATVFEQVNAISFTKPLGGANPLPQTLMVLSTDNNFYFDASAYTAAGGDWLQISSSGNGCCATPESITVSVNPSESLAAGTYTGEIVFTQYSGHGMAMTVPVTLTVAPTNSVFLDNLPGQLSFSLQPGGATPASQGVQIRNGGTGTLTWTISSSTADGGKWITLSSTTAVAPSAVNIGIDKSALPNGGEVAGMYSGQLVFKAGADVVTIPVSVVAEDSVFKQLPVVTFKKSAGGNNPPAQSLAIASTGTNFYFDVAAYAGTGGSWLRASPSGNGCCATPETIKASATPASSLKAGIYTGEIVFTQYSGHGIAMTVPVYLAISATPLIPTVTSVTSSANPSSPGESVTFTATVTPVSGSGLSGNVTFEDGSTTLATVALNKGVASFTTTDLATGKHSITAVYNGSSTFSDGTSSVLVQTVQ